MAPTVAAPAIDTTARTNNQPRRRVHPSMAARRLAPSTILALCVGAFASIAQPRDGALVRACHAQSYATMRDEHVTIAAIRIALWSWMTPPERARLDAIDTSSTRRGDTRALTLLAADRVARVVAPFALDGAHRTNDASRLRALPPVVDRASARRAAEVVSSLPFLAATEPSATGATTGPLGCDQPLTWATIALRQAGDARFADRADVAMAFCAATRVGGDRAALVDAAVSLVRDLALAARSNARHARPSAPR